MTQGPEMSSFPVDEKEPFGSLLKDRRIARGLSLDEAVIQTRIRKRFLEALEEDRFGEIPGETYVFGFLRTYAVYLGFDPAEVIASYNERFHSSPVSSPSSKEKERAESLAMRRWLLPAIALLVLAIILGGLALWYSRSDSAVIPDPTPNASGSPSEPDAAAAAVVLPEPDIEKFDAIEEVAVPEDNLPAPRSDSSPVVETEAGPVVFVPFGGALLKAEALGTGWLEITIDDRAPQRYQLEPKVILKWQIGQTFHLETERSGLLALWIDDRMIDLGERTALHVGPEPDLSQE